MSSKRNFGGPCASPRSRNAESLPPPRRHKKLSVDDLFDGSATGRHVILRARLGGEEDEFIYAQIVGRGEVRPWGIASCVRFERSSILGVHDVDRVGDSTIYRKIAARQRETLRVSE